MHQPLLYLSLYLKTNRSDYYRLLQEVRERGAWEAWTEFFLNRVAATAEQAFISATRIVDLFKQDREKIAAANRLLPFRAEQIPLHFRQRYWHPMGD